MKYKSGFCSVKAGPIDGLADGEFLVYPSTFTREPDSYGDVVVKGAFAENLAAWKESGNTIPGLFGHRMDDPDYYVASAIDTGEDDHGWWVKGAFDMESPKGRQVYNLVKSKRLTQLSFAFDVLEEGSIELPDGRKANELRKLKVYEFSFVPIGANQDTSVIAVKSGDAGMSASLGSGQVESLREAQEILGELISAAESAESDDDGGLKDEIGTAVKSEPPVPHASRHLTLMKIIDAL